MKNKKRNIGLVSFILLAFLVGAVVWHVSDGAPIETAPATTANTTTTTAALTTIGITPTGWSVQTEVDTDTPKSTLGDFRLYQDLVTWDEYTDAEFHQTEVTQTWNGLSGFILQFIDAESNLYVYNRGENNKSPEGIETLGIYSLTDSTYQPFAEVASNRYTLSFEAISEKYIVWSEGLHAQMGEVLDPAIHVYVKGTGEDIAFAMPDNKSSNTGYRSQGPSSPVLIFGDTIYFSAVTQITMNMTPQVQYMQDLFQFNIATRKRELVTADATCPFLYNGKPAWYSLDYDRKVSTAMTASGAIDGMPDVPLGMLAFISIYSPNTVIAKDRMLLWDQGNNHELVMMKDGVSTLIIANKYDAGIGIFKTDGNFIVFSEYDTMHQQRPLLFFDINRSVLVNITNEIDSNTRNTFGAYLKVFLCDNKMYFMEDTGLSDDYTYTQTLYWVELDALG